MHEDFQKKKKSLIIYHNSKHFDSFFSHFVIEPNTERNQSRNIVLSSNQPNLTLTYTHAYIYIYVERERERDWERERERVTVEGSESSEGLHEWEERANRTEWNGMKSKRRDKNGEVGR